MADNNNNNNTNNNARRQLIRDHVLALTGYDYWDERNLLADICFRWIPEDKVACKDGVVIIVILVRAGILNLNNFNNAHHPGTYTNGNFWKIHLDGWDGRIECGMNEDKRIIEFNILIWGVQYDLPADIVRLEYLQTLHISNCRSLPVEALQDLPNLESLALAWCPDLIHNFPVEMDLNLKDLRISFCRLQSPSSPVLLWIAKRLPNLFRLQFCNMYESSHIIVDFLRTADLSFRDKLKCLSMERCKDANSQTLEAILEILPTNFPNLISLHFYENRLDSIQPIARKIRSDETFTISKSLRKLAFEVNNFVTKINDGDAAEKAALLTLLNTYNTVLDIGERARGGARAPKFVLNDNHAPDVEYVLAINEAGRCLLERNNRTSSIVGAEDRPIPLSLWPLVLEKSYKKDTPNYTGAYYLLRNGPALADRAEFDQSKEESSKMNANVSKKRKFNGDSGDQTIRITNT